MTPTEFKNHQVRLEKTNAELAILLGVRERTVERWRNGQRHVPGPAAEFMRQCVLIKTKYTGVWKTYLKVRKI